MIGWLFRLPAFFYFFLSGLIVVLTAAVAYSIVIDNRDRSEALNHAPPQQVTADVLKPNKYKADYGEILLKAQTYLPAIIESVETKNDREVGRTTFVPLYRTETLQPSDTAVGVLVIKGAVSQQKFEKLFYEEGRIGPVLLINGTIEVNGVADRNEAIGALGRTSKLEQNFYVIRPFLNGRSKDLAPNSSPKEIAIIGIFLALLVAGYGHLRRRDAAREEELRSGYAD
jgi:hypothetical protein